MKKKNKKKDNCKERKKMDEKKEQKKSFIVAPADFLLPRFFSRRKSISNSLLNQAAIDFSENKFT